MERMLPSSVPSYFLALTLLTLTLHHGILWGSFERFALARRHFRGSKKVFPEGSSLSLLTRFA